MAQWRQTVNNQSVPVEKFFEMIPATTSSSLSQQQQQQQPQQQNLILTQQNTQQQQQQGATPIVIATTSSPVNQAPILASIAPNIQTQPVVILVSLQKIQISLILLFILMIMY
jgi:hypothetical protein